ncbi:MAG: adenylyl-sulfate kinase [Pseudomonadota bacterium]|nr:adenylyl-sulfate kinase [Pseudomonadota bacterium]
MVSSTEHSSVREKFKFIVQDIYKFTQKRIIVGKVISGRAVIGGKVRIHPNERLSTIKSFPDWKNKSKRTINSGESVCIEIQDDIFVDRGDLITDRYKPLVSDSFFCNLFSISGQDLKEGQKFNLRYLTKDVAVQIVKIESVLNPIADKLIDGKNIPQNHYAKVLLQSNELLSLDAEKSQNTTKRFVLSDDFRVAALGFFEDDDFRRIEKERTTKSQNITHVFHEISAKEREKKSGHGGGVLWFTGLSASGKSTLGNRVEKILFDKGYNVTLLDGDNLRFGLNNDLGFSEKDRDENIRRAAEVSSLFARRGFLVISTFISPYDKQRANARKIIGKNFHEIYIKASLKNCEKRDPKGLYKKARRGEIQMFSGISAPYEEPGNPELLLNTNKVNIEKCTEKLVGYIKDHFRIVG